MFNKRTLLFKLNQLGKQEEGNAIILVGFALLGLILMSGLVIDGGSMYMTKRHLQKTANAAVLSGAQELTNTEAAVKDVTTKVLEMHGETSSLEQLNVTMFSRVSLDLKKDVKLAFSQLFGYSSIPIVVHAAAEIGTMSNAVGASPLGIDDTVQLEFYKEYRLKVDQQEVNSGNFGVLALGGTGAQTYEDNLMYGYKEQLNVRDILDTQTGNISGKTRTVIQAKINACPYQPGDTTQRDCPRVILIPVYKPHLITTNQLKQVEIKGFAYFYITKPMSSNDTSITGMFIKRSGRGYVDPTVVNKGAFSIRLTE